MNTDTTAATAAGKPAIQPHPEPVTIEVNKRPVTMPDKKATGLQVKKEAIAQGVSIKADFLLFRVDGKAQHQIADDQEIELHKDEAFRAVAPDDNS
ncbi:MAG: multiubiquitin domain-containing protein [Deltaproteobacteria bacterium]|nr:multiubiquitin domain-containing protein [Deltaproteobacteria bacterium]